MKLKYLFIIVACLTNIVLSQTMKVYKTDKTTLDFTLANVDSITFSTSPTGNIISLSSYKIFTDELTQVSLQESSGVYSESDEGIVISGTNANLEEIHIKPITQSLLDSKDIYLRWKSNGTINTNVELYSDAEISTKIQTAALSSTAMKTDVWYYTRISVSSNSILVNTSTDNYDNFGGNVVYSNSAMVNGNPNNFAFTAKIDKASNVTLAESRTE